MVRSILALIIVFVISLTLMSCKEDTINPVTPTTEPPVIKIISPASNAEISDSVLVEVEVTDNKGITKVEFYVNNIVKKSWIMPPYQYWWDLSNDPDSTKYSIYFKAYDEDDNVTSSQVNIVTVKNTKGNIEGVVTDTSGRRLSGVLITTSPATVNVNTDTSGRYKIKKVNPGSYVISAAAAGYYVNTTNVNVHSGQTATGNITLQTNFMCGINKVNYAGMTYNTVQIGSQCWLKENLNLGTRINGTANPSNNGTIEKYCYNDNEANCNTYGGLYTWNEAMGYSTTAGARGICPEGWHIPTNAEFETLASSVSNNSNALKAGGQGTGSGAGTNTSGFSALLAGIRNTNDLFNGQTYYALFWSSTEDSSTDARYIGLYYYNSGIEFDDRDKYYGFSIRCSKD